MAVKTWTSERVTSADINTYLTNSGLVYVSEVSFSGAASASINNCFTSSFDHYRINISLIGSVAGNSYNMRLRTGGVDNTAANYYYYGFYWITSAVNLTTTAATGFFLNNRSATATGYDLCTVELFNPQKPVLTTHRVESMETNTGLYIQTSGFYSATTTQFDGFTLYPGSGTLTGTARVYGYRQA
jgi:hypothetical protein